MKNITTDDIFEDIGFDKHEATNMKVRAELVLEISNLDWTCFMVQGQSGLEPGLTTQQ